MNPLQQTPEQPLYVLPQSKVRALIPKIGSLLILSIIFYLGVLLNVTLLNLSLSTEKLVKLIALIFLLLINLLGFYFAYHKAFQPYKFFRTKIQQNKKSINYINIINVTAKKDLFDKIFKTYTINLGNNFFIRNVPETIKISDYIQKLVNYSKSTTSPSTFR